MTQAKLRISPELACLSRSAWENLIYEANLGTEDADMATRYFIHRQCQIDIAIDKDLARTTVTERLGKARKRIEQVYFGGLPS